ncbi:transcriptional regulator domain-containing protein [Mesorhizobium loti]|uniref:transcriptional regulator domain-containing protein n=1 Tax=Rhizobium loti TaxID=381 RepID=UPI003D7C14AB
MPEQGTWRNSTAYDYVNELDPEDLAWEFLRRNAEYKQDYVNLERRGEARSASLFSAKWGLSFRCRSRGPRPRRERHVDAQSRPLDADPAVQPDMDRIRL